MRLLSLGQLKKLEEWLHELIRRVDRAENAKLRKQSAAERNLDNKTYRLESIRCGKERCKCTRGKLHGPYWYSYTRTKDKITSQYIGKSLPKDVERVLKSRGEK